MVATVADGELTQLRPDPDHPLSQGFACPKGIAMTEVQNDPDRVLHPLRAPRRTARSSASPGTRRWTTSATGCGAIIDAARRRVRSAGTWATPARSRYSHPLWVKGFLDALGSPHFYTASSQDVSNRFAASSLLYGSPFIVPIPDLDRTDFLLIVGANPLVSHGSVLSAPRIKDQLHAITERGGRVVVVDPRRSETARAFEHVAIDPDADAWLLLSMLEVIFDEGLEDRGAIERQATRDRARCAQLAAEYPPEATEARTGVPARDRSASSPATSRGAERAAVYGRTGSCLGRHGTLVSFLLDALNVVTGNLDREGGAMFGDPPIDFSRVAELVGAGSYAQGPLAGRRPARGARLAARVGDGEGDDDAGRGADEGDVRLRGQPGALGPERRRARGGDRGGSSSRSRSTSTSPTPPGTPTTSCRRRRSSSARTSRCRS